MSDQIVPLRYEMSVKDDATGAMAKILAAAEKLDRTLVSVTAREKAAADAARTAADQAAKATDALAEKRMRALIRVRGEQAIAADRERAAAKASADATATVGDEAERADGKMRGLKGATALVSVGLREMGAAGAAEVAMLTAHATHLIETFGKVGAVGAATASIFWAGSKVLDAIAHRQISRIEELNRHMLEQVGITQDLDAAHKAFTLGAEARQRGVSESVVETERAIAKERKELLGAQATIDSLRRQGVTGEEDRGILGFIGAGDLTGKIKEFHKAEAVVAQAEGNIERLEQASADRLALIYRARADAWQDSELARVQASRSAAAELVKAAEAAEAKLAVFASGRRGWRAELAQTRADEDAAFEAAVRAQQEPLRAQRAQQIAAAKRQGLPTQDIKDRFDRAIIEASVLSPEAHDALKKRWDAIRKLIVGEAERADADALKAATRGSVLASATMANLDADEASRRRAVLEAERDFEIGIAEQTGHETESIKKKWIGTFAQMDADEAVRRKAFGLGLARSAEDAALALARAQASAGLDPSNRVGGIQAGREGALASERAAFARATDPNVVGFKLTTDELERITRAHKDRIAEINASADGEMKHLSDTSHLALTRSTEDFLRGIENLHRTSSEAAFADEQARFRREMADADKNNADREALEAEHLARMELLREQAATVVGQRQEREDRAGLILNDPNAKFRDGLDAGALRIQNQLKTSAELGAASVDALATAFVNLGDNATSGSMKAGESLKRFAVDAVNALRQIAMQQLALQVFGSIFGAATSSPGGYTVNGQAGGWTQTGPNTWAASGVQHAEGGVSSVPAIFGERGAEAAVPLSRGRSIPVELRGRGGGGSPVHITVAPKFEIHAMDSKGVAAALAESQDTISVLVADSLGRDARIRAAVKNAMR